MSADDRTMLAVAATASAPALGSVVHRKYLVERLLGSGGMGYVVSARHLELGHRVALKLMHAEIACDASAAQRFSREARAVSRLRGEHVARVLDFDRLPDGTPYIAMEYLEGEDLAAVLASRGPRSEREAAHYVVQICEAIAEAHVAGIIHRDLKPANVFITRRSDGSTCVKVLDFGVSKIVAGDLLEQDFASTDTRALVGSPQYMAPEQLAAVKTIDARVDIWALGCILYELVTGRMPFDGGSLAALLASILRDEPAPLAVVAPGISPAYVAIVERCLAKQPDSRFQTADELAAALSTIVRDEPTPRRSRRGAYVAAAAALVVTCAIAIAVWPRSSSPAPIVAPALIVAPVATPAPPVATPVAPPPPPPPVVAAPAVAPVRHRAPAVHHAMHAPTPPPNGDLLPPDLGDRVSP